MAVIKWRINDSVLFNVGLCLRLLLILAVVPVVQQQWFVPFLQHAAWPISFDPWCAFMRSGGDAIAFPYGIVMAIGYLPGQWLANIGDWLVPSSLWPHWGMGLSSLLFDYLLFRVITKLSSSSERKVLLYYWLSPFVIYICYWHGQMDILPVLLLASGLWYLSKHNGAYAGALVAASITAKFSMVLTLPIVLIYLWRNSRVRPLLWPFACVTVLGIVLMELPFMLHSPYYLNMVFQNPQFNKVTLVAIDLTVTHKIYVLPLVYMLFLYVIWRMERLSEELLFIMLGITFLIILLLTPAAIGWYLWIMPFVVLYQSKHASTAENLVIIALYCLLTVTGLLYQAGVTLTWLQFSHLTAWHEVVVQVLAPYHAHGDTAISALLIIISISMFNKGVRDNNYYRLSRRPIAIGIAGDSGSGKDTLSAAIADVFSCSTVTSVSGDDYHKWDRYSPMWKKLTHLDPHANNLNQFANDVLQLIDGKNIRCRHYDHSTGRFTLANPIRKNNSILVSGLHALYLKKLRDQYDVAIYLLMDDELRRYFKLKRDVYIRGHSEEKVLKSMAIRAKDADNYLKPQIPYADIVFRIEPVNRQAIADYRQDNIIHFRLVAEIKNAVYYEDLMRYLIGLCAVSVHYRLSDDCNTVTLSISGDVSSEDIAIIARKMIKHIDELLAYEPKWHHGVTGLMQLITFLHLSESIRARITSCR